MKKEPELSIILPCRNEEKTIGKCIEQVLDTFKEKKIRGEVIVSDSSTDSESDGDKQNEQPKKNIEPVKPDVQTEVDSESDSDSDEPIEMHVKGTMCLLDGINLYKMTESKQKGELYGTFINGKVKKIKQSGKEIDL